MINQSFLSRKINICDICSQIHVCSKIVKYKYIINLWIMCVRKTFDISVKITNDNANLCLQIFSVFCWT